MKNLIQEMEQEVVKKIGSIGDSVLSTLGTKCAELLDIREQLADLAQQKKQLSEKEFKLEQEEIPAVMEENNLTSLKLKDGQNIEVAETYHASILVANREFCYKWLKDN